jgi:hypothetical protein
MRSEILKIAAIEVRSSRIQTRVLWYLSTKTYGYLYTKLHGVASQKIAVLVENFSNFILELNCQ